MTNTLDSTTQHQIGVPAETPLQAVGDTPHRHSAFHIVAIVIGCLMLLPGLGILVGGGALAIGQAVATDDDGYFQFTLDRVASEGVAVATTHLWLADVDDEAGPWVLDWLDLDVRLRVDGANSSDQVFVGIARSADVERYLARATYSEVVEIDGHTPAYRQITGTTTIGSPLDQDFWAASTSGPGEQELAWEARGGRWSVVVMNADGSPDVSADIEIGARSDAVTPIAIALIVFGTIISGLSIALIVIGVRGRRPGKTRNRQASIRSPFPPPPMPTTPPVAPEHAAPTGPDDHDLVEPST